MAPRRQAGSVLIAVGSALFLVVACSSSPKAPTESVGKPSANKTAAADGSPMMADRFLLMEVSPNNEVTPKGRADISQAFAKLFENGQYEKAEEKARRILKSEPFDKQALMYLVTALLLEKKYALASVYTSLNQRNLVNDADYLNLRGVAAYQDNRGPEGIRQAGEAFTAALKANPRHMAALLNQAYLALETSRTEDAEDGFKEARRVCKDCYLAILGLGNASFKNGKYKEAISYYQAAVGKRPNDYETMLLIANAYFFGLKDKANAETMANQALQAAPKSDVDTRDRIKDLKRQINGEAPAES